MTPIQALILGLVQGFTEFLPVSSSGHLVLAQSFFGLEGDMLSFDIFVHFGTLLAVLFVFNRRIASLISACISAPVSIVRGQSTAVDAYRGSPDLRIAIAIIVGSIPAGIIGFTLNDRIERLFSQPLPVAGALFVTGALLLATFRAGRGGNERIGILRGFIVGIAQAISIIPGISRSGSTIAAALFLKSERNEAGEFSFLLSLPAVAGATLLAVKNMSESGVGIPVGAIVLGTIASFVSGLVSLVLLMRIIRAGRIGYFGFYCIAVSIAAGLYILL